MKKIEITVLCPHCGLSHTTLLTESKILDMLSTLRNTKKPHDDPEVAALKGLMDIFGIR